MDYLLLIMWVKLGLRLCNSLVLLSSKHAPSNSPNKYTFDFIALSHKLGLLLLSEHSFKTER